MARWNIGAKNGVWKSGRSVASNGYVLIRVGLQHHLADTRGYAYEHRVMAEKKIGRRLKPRELVHHIDHNRQNNALSNLEICATHAHHRLAHRKASAKVLRLPGEPNPSIACDCGCGLKFLKYDASGRPRRFLSGHNPRKSPTIDAIMGLLKCGQKQRSEIIRSSGRGKYAIAVALYKLKNQGLMRRRFMAKATKISWSHATFNPWRGCVKISEACRSCYALGWAKRTGQDIWGTDRPRAFAAENYWREPEAWNREAEQSGQPFRVFCASLADICEDRDDLLEPRARLMRLIEQTPALTWMLLTKRPENFERFFGKRWNPDGWPRNVWAGTTVEHPDQAWRLKHLCRVPAVVRFCSAEPLLGPLMLHGERDGLSYRWLRPEGVTWLIVGGESSSKARPMNPEWVRALRDQCVAIGTPFHFKQWGEWIGGVKERDGMRGVVSAADGTDEFWPVNATKRQHWFDCIPGYEHGTTIAFRVGVKRAGRLLDGREWNEFPVGSKESRECEGYRGV